VEKYKSDVKEIEDAANDWKFIHPRGTTPVASLTPLEELDNVWSKAEQDQHILQITLDKGSAMPCRPATRSVVCVPFEGDKTLGRFRVVCVPLCVLKPASTVGFYHRW